MFVFRNYDLFFDKNYKSIISLYLLFSVLLFFVTIFGYYIDNPLIGKNIVTENNQNMPDYIDRISIGQPAIACFPQIISGTYFLSMKKKNTLIYLSALICFLGVLLSTSITGIMTLFFILILISIKKLIIDSLKQKIVILFFTTTIVLLFSILIESDFFISNFSIPYAFVVNRIDQYLFDSSVDQSMVMRQNQGLYVIEHVHNAPLGWILGEGCTGIFIENTYYGFLLRYGVLGLCCLFVYFISLIFEAVKDKKNDFILVLIVIYLAHFYTLDVFYTSTLCYTFPLFINYIFWHFKHI